MLALKFLNHVVRGKAANQILGEQLRSCLLRHTLYLFVFFFFLACFGAAVFVVQKVIVARIVCCRRRLRALCMDAAGTKSSVIHLRLVYLLVANEFCLLLLKLEVGYGLLPRGTSAERLPSFL